MATTTRTMDDATFQRIYTDKRFRNTVAYAHQCCKAGGEFSHWKTCDYPTDYIVTPEHIAEAKAEQLRDKEQLLTEYDGKLVLIGMGMTYTSRYDGDVCNYRVRGEFINAKGNQYFVEFGQDGREPNKMRCDHSIDRTKEELLERSFARQGEYYNYGGLEGNGIVGEYTLPAILQLINRHFGCNFKEVVIDNYTMGTDHISVSPKQFQAVAA